MLSFAQPPWSSDKNSGGPALLDRRTAQAARVRRAERGRQESEPDMTSEPSVAPMTLTTVVASTRPGRVGRSVADWFTTRVAEYEQFASHLVDLRELALPFYDEPHPPALRPYTKSHTQAWSRIVDASDRSCSSPPSTTGAFRLP